MKTEFFAFAPGAILGLSIGRLLSELWALANGSTSLLLAGTLTLITTIAGAYLLRRYPFSKSWPTLILLFYIFFPEFSLLAAAAVGLITLLIAWQLSSVWPAQASSRSWAISGALVAAALFLILYVLTLAPDILPADNGEFQLVATKLGIAHPPGFALYTMLAHMMTRLPIGPTPAYRVNLLSAITSTLTLLVLYGTVFLLTKRHLAAVTAVIALGAATTYWAQATTANIRSLSALFAALMFLSLLAFYQGTGLPRDENGKRKADRSLILFGLILGLGVSHHASLAFMGLVGVIFLLLVDPSLAGDPRRWWKPLLALLVGLIPLIYIPFRAYSGVRGSSPDLATLPGFLEHILALGFRGDLFTYLEPTLLWERFKIMGNVLTFQFELLLLTGMVLGLLVLLRRDWRLAFLIGGSFALHTFITATYRAPQTVEYMLPAYIPLAILLGTAIGDPSAPWQELKVKGSYLPLREILAAIMLLAALRQLMQNYPSYQWLHGNRMARDYAQSLLQAAPADSVILSDWHWVTPLWYLQEVEDQRPDVTVRFVFPEGASYAETWVKRIEEALDNGKQVISTHFEPGSFSTLPPAEPLQTAFLFRQEPRKELPKGYTPLDTTLGERVHLLGYQTQAAAVEAGREIVLNLAWKAVRDLEPGTTIFVHLSDASGELYAQEDLPAQAQPEGITLTQFRLTPRLDAQPGPYTLLSGAYGTKPLLDSSGNERTELAVLSIAAKKQPQVTSNPMQRMIPGEIKQVLTGYDWDNSLSGQQRLYLHWRTDSGYQTEVHDDGQAWSLPPYSGPWGVTSERWSSVTDPGSGYYIPFGEGIVWYGEPLNSSEPLSTGESVTLDQYFRSSQPVMHDYAVSVRLIGFEDDGYHWAWWDLDDGVPAMGAIPTLKWIGGSQVRSPHFVSVNSAAPGGQQIGAALNLYDTFTGRLLPILDERISADYAWVPLSETAVQE